jgi:pimeloyl-ACP methyl ester carboxylesterase
MSMATLCRVHSILIILAVSITSNARTLEPTNHPVDEIAGNSLRVTTSAGVGVLPVYVSKDVSKVQPEVTRAIVIFHGVKRNAVGYFRSANEAADFAGKSGKGTLVIAPQFLIEEDAAAFNLNSTILRWHHSAWEGGGDASGPAPISSFDAIDAILAELADRSRFPGLQQVVLAGHSAGGQVVQRYAVMGRGEAALVKLGIHVRYVVANPSSYVYFSQDRPVTTSTFARYEGSCKTFNRWKYGTEDPPPYIGQRSFAEMEDDYIRRDIIYLLGTSDTDPRHPELDISCEGEAQGPHRFARGMAYFSYLKARHPDNFAQRLWEVPHVGHDEREMFHSKCGMQALFDIPGCASAKGR